MRVWHVQIADGKWSQRLDTVAWHRATETIFGLAQNPHYWDAQRDASATARLVLLLIDCLAAHMQNGTVMTPRRRKERL